MGLLRNVRRFARSYKILIYFVGIILLVQALIAFNSHPNLLEEEKLLRIRNLEIQKHRKQLALAGMKNDEGLFMKGKNNIDLYNPKDPRFRKQFNEHAKDSIDILEDHNLQLADNTLKKSYVVDDYNTANEFNLYDDDLTEKGNWPFSYKPECEITLGDAKSALSRASSDQCKQQIADTTCKMQNHTLFPKEMPRYCSHEGKFVFNAPKPKSFSQNIRPIRICYMLQVHGRAFRQFRRLLKVIYNKNHYYYIHVDKRSDYLLREIQRETEKYPNIKVANWRMATIWGGSSLLQMLLHAISDVLRFWKDWDFFINLSALDFPIESEENVVNFLGTYHDKNFMKSHGRDDEKFIRKQGLNRVFVECDQHMWRLGDRELPKGITVNGGSDWVALNRGYCDYIINGNDKLLKELKFWYKYTLLPAESFFHTLAQNSDRCESFVDNNLRVTNWNRARGCKCQYKHIVDWCGCSPNDFFPSDLGRLQTTRPVYFARKFEEVINQEVVNHLDFKIYGKYPTGSAGLSSYWENVYSHEDGPTSIGDEYLTHYSSFARMGLAQVGQGQDSSCQIEIQNLLEVELFKKEEIFEGYLVTLDVKSLNATQPSPKIQIFVSHQPPLRIIDHSSELARRLDSAAIGTNWDIKELTLRDWGGVMGPNSALHLVAQWSHGDDDFVVTVVVIDPLGVVADYNDFRTPAKSAGVTDTPLSLRKPLRPGRWLVRFYVQREFTKVCAELEFFVSPLQFKDGVEGARELGALNRGVVEDDQLNSANRNLFSIRTTLNLRRNTETARELQDNSQHLAGTELHRWIDAVLSGGWKVKDFCLAADSLKQWASAIPKHCQQLTPLNLCPNMSWSSLSPDPKSELTHIKPDGRIR